MGKHKKSRNRHKRRNKNSLHSSIKNDDETSANKSSIVDKIQSTNTKTRDATLSALSVTLFSSKKLLDDSLVGAVLRRLSIDSDESAACNAAGCIINYIITSSSCNDFDSAKKYSVESVMEQLIKLDVLTLLLCTLNNNKKPARLHELLLHILCLIIENGNDDVVIERLSKGDTGEMCSSAILSHLEVENDLGVNCRNVDAQMFAARALHAILDDGNNLDILKFLDSVDLASRLCKSIISNGSSPARSRLHGCGIILSLATSNKHGNIQNLVEHHVHPVILQYIDYRCDIASALVERLVFAEKELAKESDDAVMETNVEKVVTDKKESARSIARRQKEMKKEIHHEESAKDTSEKSDQRDINNESINKNEGQDTDLQRNVESALNAWENAIQPLKLSLEITANACSENRNVLTSFGDDGMEDVHVTSKSNVKWLQQHNGPLSKLLVVLESLVIAPFLDQSIQVQKDMCEVIGKCAACIGNILAVPECNVGTLSVIEIWRGLAKCLSVVENEIDASGDVSAAMMSIIRACTTQVAEGINSEDLNILVSALAESKCAETRINVATMLGQLCLTPHDKSVDDLVCKQLLSSLNNDTSNLVVAEVLCATMDIYGQDEAHLDVFQSNNGVVILKNILPSFRRRINEVSLNKDDANISYLQETASNAKRFIAYLQQELQI